MPLQTQYVDVPFSGTLDQKSDKDLVIQGNFTNLENVVFTKAGAVEKRPGNDSITADVFGSADPLPAPRSLVGYDENLLALGEHKLYALNEANTTWYDNGEISEPTIQGSIVASILGGYLYLTSAKANNITTYLYTDFANVYSTVVDDSGVIILNNVKINTGGSGSNPRIAVIGNTITALFSRGVAIIATQLDTTNPTGWSAETSLTGVVYAGGTWDACSLTDRFAIAYQIAGPNIAVATYDNSLTAVNAAAFAGSGTVRSVAIAGSNAQNSIWVTFGFTGAASGATCRQYNLALSSILTSSTSVFTGLTADSEPLRMANVLVNNGADVMVIANTSQDVGVAYSPGALTRYYVTGNGVGGPGLVSFNLVRSFNDLLLVTKPFQVGTHVYAGVRSQIERTFYLVDLDVDRALTHPFRPVATYGDYVADITEDLPFLPGVTPAIVSDVVILSNTQVAIPGFTFVGSIRNVGSFTATFDTQFTFAENNGALTMSGGVPSSFDGNKVVELESLVRPVITAAVPAFVAGSLPSGIYRYQAVYEWTDAKGQIYRSTPSDIYTFDNSTHAPPTKNIFTVTYDTFSRMQTANGVLDPVRVVIYREFPINSGTYRKLALGTVTNLVTQKLFTYTDDDAGHGQLGTETLIYTLSGLANGHPPTAKYAINHGGRTWLGGLDIPTQIWFSKPLIEGVATGFSPAQIINIDDGGEVTGLASLDDKLVVFKHERIYIVYGAGPTPLGTGGVFTTQRIAVDKGCIDALSIVTTKDGVMFRSAVGIYLLSRGLEMSYIGAPVEETTDSFTGTVAAVRHPTEPWVLFVLGPDGSSQSVILLYDNLQNKWAKWYMLDVGVPANIKSATIYRDKFAWITAAGSPYLESAQYLDNGSYVTMTIETAWLKLAGLVGFQRIRQTYLLGEPKSPHQIEFSFAQNYDDTAYTQTTTFDSNVLAWPSEQFAVTMVTQKSNSLRIRLRDLAPLAGVGTGQGLVFAGIGLEVGIKGKTFNNLPLAQGG